MNPHAARDAGVSTRLPHHHDAILATEAPMHGADPDF